MENRPRCAKMSCTHGADVVLHLLMFGPVYFCADHALSNLKEDSSYVL
jgi:hypothetical protein